MGPVNTPRLPLDCPLPRLGRSPERFCLRPRKRRLRKLLRPPLGREFGAAGAAPSGGPDSEEAGGTEASGAENGVSSPEFPGGSDEKLLVSIVRLFSFTTIASGVSARRKILNQPLPA